MRALEVPQYINQLCGSLAAFTSRSKVTPPVSPGIGVALVTVEIAIPQPGEIGEQIGDLACRERRRGSRPA